jgi:dihydrofolate reductase
VKSNVIIIAAVSKNGVIGLNNQMPWNIPEELASFKKITSDNNVIMGMNTYESIGKLLPNRKNYIMTRKNDIEIPDATIVKGFGEMMFHLLEKANETFYVIGGKSIFDLYLPLAGKLIISEIDIEVAGDTYFPKLDLKNWKLVKEIEIPNKQNIKIIQKHYEKVYF